jgi:hypothetical protein
MLHEPAWHAEDVEAEGLFADKCASGPMALTLNVKISITWRMNS